MQNFDALGSVFSAVLSQHASVALFALCLDERALVLEVVAHLFKSSDGGTRTLERALDSLAVHVLVEVRVEELLLAVGTTEAKIIQFVHNEAVDLDLTVGRGATLRAGILRACPLANTLGAV